MVGYFQQEALTSFCFSCLWDILRSRAEANATCCRLLPAPVLPQASLQKSPDSQKNLLDLKKIH